MKKFTSFCQVLKEMHAKQNWFLFSDSRCRNCPRSRSHRPHCHSPRRAAGIRPHALDSAAAVNRQCPINHPDYYRFSATHAASFRHKMRRQKRKIEQKIATRLGETKQDHLHGGVGVTTVCGARAEAMSAPPEKGRPLPFPMGRGRTGPDSPERITLCNEITGALKTQVLENACTDNASTENASTMQTFSRIKKVWYFTS